MCLVAFATGHTFGFNHDLPRHRFVLWAVDEDVAETSPGSGL
jgi:hypothetical protein